MAKRPNTAKWELAVAALLAEPSTEKAAAKIGMAERTLRNWLANPEFAALYRLTRRQIVEAAVGKLQLATTEAVDTLQQLLKCDHSGTQARAAIAILDHAHRGIELYDLVEEIEKLKAERKDGSP